MYNIIEIRSTGMKDFGYLSFFESNRDIPFLIKRIYYIYSVPKDVKRGAHAHKELQQMLFCPYGAVKILLDDGSQKTEIILDSPSKGLVLTPCIWRDMVWIQENSVLCVAVSDYYDEEDYIRDYDEFKKWVNKQ